MSTSASSSSSVGGVNRGQALRAAFDGYPRVLLQRVRDGLACSGGDAGGDAGGGVGSTSGVFGGGVSSGVYGYTNSDYLFSMSNLFDGESDVSDDEE